MKPTKACPIIHVLVTIKKTDQTYTTQQQHMNPKCQEFQQ